MLKVFSAIALLPAALMAVSSPDEGEARRPVRLSQQPIITTIQGIALIPDEQMGHCLELSHVCGLQAYDLDIPGGIECLRERLEPLFLCAPYSKALLDEIKKEIILYYRSAGRPVVTVYVPEQDVTEGVIKLVVVEACLGEVRVCGNRWFSDKMYGKFVRLRPGRAITADTLLTDVAWMNRNPFRDANVFFVPGADEGTTDIELRVSDRFPVQFYGGGDNTGNTATGNTRWYAGATWGNVFGLGHILNYQYTTTTNVKRFQAHSFHYTALLPWRNLILLWGGYAVVEPDIPGFPKNKGHDFQGSARYAIPFGETYYGKVQETRFGFDFKNYDNNLIYEGDLEEVDVVTGTINLTQFVLGYAWASENAKAKFAFDIDLYGSPVRILSNQTDADYDELSAGADVRYIYGRTTMGATWYLPAKYEISALGRLQIASGALLPSEQFGLGGYDTVRGYDERIVNIDNALCLNFEFRFRPFSLLRFFGACCPQDYFTFLAFWDYGLGIPWERKFKLDLANNEPVLPPTEWLMSVGPGIRYVITNYLSARADWGVKLHRTTFDDGSRSQFNLGFVISY
ncbi:MAG: Heme/hemopexin transporter protein HuxB [Chlamydiae bacterium]|nr:Heme/hemopexin transporter protein HuxB [Chlamydiota bacterium]